MPIYSRDTEDQRILKSEGLRACQGQACSKLRDSVLLMTIHIQKIQSKTPNYQTVPDF